MNSIEQAVAPNPEVNVANLPVKPGKLMRLPAVMEQTTLGRSSIYAGVKNKTFPAPVRLSARAVGWRETDISNWLNARVQIGAQQ